MAYIVLHPALPIHPGIVKVRTRLKSDSGRTMLANCITLTPGTLTVDVSEDGHLYIHWIDVRARDVQHSTEMIVDRFEKYLIHIFD
jgi:multicomponent Na+:H+ antiporter subunit E